MKLIINLLILLLSVNYVAKAQIQSSSQLTPQLQNFYNLDVHHIALNRIYDSNSPAITEITIPTQFLDTIWDGLAAVHNAYPLTARDSVFDIYCMHHWGYAANNVNHTIYIKADQPTGWASAWTSGQTLTGYGSVDFLLTTYGFTLSGYLSSINVAEFTTTQNLNLEAFCSHMENITGIDYSEIVPVYGDGNTISYNKIGDNQYFTFDLAFGDCYAGCIYHRKWKYKVNYLTKIVEYLGMTNSPPLNGYPLPNPSNCNLTGNPSYSYQAIDHCGDSVFFNNTWYHNSEIFNDTLTNSMGDDSIVFNSILVNPAYLTINEFNLCEGDSLFFNGVTYHNSVFESDTFSTQMGCDSTFNVTINFHPPDLTYDTVSVCTGDTYLFHNQSLSSPGDYSATFQSVYGCDSLVNLHLIYNSLSTVYDTTQFCSGTNYQFGNQQLVSAGDYSNNFTSMYSCDSLVYLHLIELSTSTSHLSAQICDNESYLFYGQSLSTSGDYYQYYTATNGCDSIIHLNLIAHETFDQQITTNICHGQFFEFNGQLLDSSGTYTHATQSVTACDSIVTLNLQVNPPFNIIDSAEICEGEIYVMGNTSYVLPGNYSDSLLTNLGCDSIVQLSLTVHPIPEIEINPSIFDSLNIDSGLVELPDVLPVGGQFSGIGLSGNYFDPQTTGTGQHWIYYNYQDPITGCSNQDSILFLVLDQIAINEISISNGIVVYPNPSKGMVYISSKDQLNHDYTIRIYNILGSELLQTKAKKNTVEIDMSSFHKGCYFFQIQKGDDITLRRVSLL